MLLKGQNMGLVWPDFLTMLFLLTIYIVIRFYFGIKRKSPGSKSTPAPSPSPDSGGDGRMADGDNGNIQREEDCGSLGQSDKDCTEITSSTPMTTMLLIPLHGAITESFYHGLSYLLLTVGILIGSVLMVELFMPLFRRLEIRSTSEYLGERFNYPVRFISVIFTVFYMLFYLGAHIDLIAMVYSHLTGIPQWYGIVSVSVLLLGFQLVTNHRLPFCLDVCQLGILLVGIVGLMVLGLMTSGASVEKFKEEALGQFHEWLNMSRNYNPVSIVIGGVCWIASALAVNSIIVGRCLRSSSMKATRRVVYTNSLCFVLLTLLLVVCGFSVRVLFKNHVPNDNDSAVLIRHYDSIIAQWVMSLTRQLPCIKGIFIAVLMILSNCAIASGLRDTSKFLIDEFIIHFYERRGAKLPSQRAMKSLRLVGSYALALLLVPIAIGCNVTGVGTIQLCIGLTGLFAASILVVCVTGAIIPCVNTKGAFCGLIAGFFAGLGLFVYYQLLVPINAPAELINNFNATNNIFFMMPSTLQRSITSAPTFSIEPLYFGPLAMLVALFVTLFISLVTGMNRNPPVHRQLLTNLAQAWCICEKPTTSSELEVTEEVWSISDDSGIIGSSRGMNSTDPQRQFNECHEYANLQQSPISQHGIDDVYYDQNVTTFGRPSPRVVIDDDESQQPYYCNLNHPFPPPPPQSELDRIGDQDVNQRRQKQSDEARWL